MRMINDLLDIDLQLFDGAAAAAPAGESGGGGQQGEAGALPKADDGQRHGSSRRGRTGDTLSNVVYGRQEDASAGQAAEGPAAGDQGQGKAASGVTTTSDTLEAKRQAFEELINGEYKDLYTQKFQEAFNRRFRDVKGMEQTISNQKPIMDMLMARYGVDDVDKLQSAIEEDTGYWQEAADEAGMTVEQYKQFQAMERENAALRQEQERREGEERANEQLRTWYTQAEAVQQLYPGFDLQGEIGNPDFVGLLRAGISVQQAYELCHMEEIKANAAKSAAQAAGQQMVARLQQKAARPMENGTSGQSAAIIKNDVHNLTRTDRAEIARRVQRGEKIQF